MRIFLLLCLALTLTASTCTTGDECGPFNFSETPFRDRDTIGYHWPAKMVRVDGYFDKSEIIRWQHADSVRFEMFAHGVTYDDNLAELSYHKSHDSMITVFLRHPSSVIGSLGASVDCTPASWEIDLEIKVFAPDGKDIYMH